MHLLKRRPFTRILLLIGLSLAVGCGGSVKGTVTGEVKYDGRPLPSGTITFLGQAGNKQVASSDITDGRYTIPAMEPGAVKVTVLTVPPSKGGQPPNGKGIEVPGASQSTKPYTPIPGKYANQDQSGLTYDVKAGAQTKDFDLTR